MLPIRMRLREYPRKIEQPGDFRWRIGTDGQRKIVIALPDFVVVIPVAYNYFEDLSHLWAWDGNELNPTITPNIRGYFINAGEILTS